MSGWIQYDLERMGAALHLQLATFKKDGTLRKPVVIWVVRVDDDLYVRSWRGPTGAWFRHIQGRPEARIVVDGVMKDVTLVDASSDEALNNEIDAVYQSKYRRSSATYVRPMIAPQARATTLKLVPSSEPIFLQRKCE